MYVKVARHMPELIVEIKTRLMRENIIAASKPFVASHNERRSF